MISMSYQNFKYVNNCTLTKYPVTIQLIIFFILYYTELQFCLSTIKANYQYIKIKKLMKDFISFNI